MNVRMTACEAAKIRDDIQSGEFTRGSACSPDGIELIVRGKSGASTPLTSHHVLLRWR